jgi:hypothetical protein
MRQLSSCDFCDATASLGVYEVVPDDLDVAERRLVLCPDCRDRLDWVLEPFLDALGESPASEHEDVTLLGVSQSSTQPTPPRPDRSADDASQSDDLPSPSAEESAGPAPRTPDDETDELEREEADSDDSDPPTAAPAGPSAADRSSDDTPPKYRQVMRFLGNRDLPIDRTEAETLASGAYDLDAGEAAKIIDAALERGLLVEDDGQLRPAE